MPWALAWSVGAALVSVAAVWWLMPGTPSASNVATSALNAAIGGGSQSHIAQRIEQAIPADAHVIVVLGSQPTATVTPGSSSGIDSIQGTGVDPGQSAVTSPASQLQPSQAQQSQVTILPGTAAASTLISDQEGHNGTTAVAFSQASRTWVTAALPSAGGIPAVLVAAVVSFLVGLGGVFLGRGLTRRVTTAVETVNVQAPADAARTEPDPELRRLRTLSQQRTVLVRRLAELLPQMPESLAWQASKALNEAGVHAFAPDGELFDPVSHHAVGTEPAESGMENTVARTIRPGYRDSQQVLVYPKVVVYVDANERDCHERP